ncbi:GAK system ATP-grasp enzyme [Magnetococcus sp. PR-3]|uniref:GAK system ATP-grasp enzyme n=1 Tax=Magnetococcus sp. PR-3 TaxID=3120355 RepID=UPI002FCE0812
MSKPRIGVIGIPGKWSTETLADAVAAATGERLVFDMAHVVLDLSSNQLYGNGVNLCELDGLIVKKISAEYNPNTLDRLELLRIAEGHGVRVFSPAESMIRLVDRLSCTVTLRNADIPMPETTVTEDVTAAMEAVRRYGKAVFKPLFSTKARGMTVIDGSQDDAALRAEIEAFQQTNPMMYLQKKVKLPGRDLGLVFLNGTYLGAYARVPQDANTWNTTIHSGGKYALAEPNAEIVEMARKAQALFNLDFTTVDVAETESGPICFEVSAFGGFRGAKDGLGIDAAELYVAHVLNSLNV